MHIIDLDKRVRASLIVLVLGGVTLVGGASSVAADLGPYIGDEQAILEHPPVRHRIVIEESYSAPPIEHYVTERRIVERRIVEGYAGPARVPPQYLPMVTAQEIEGQEGPALIPPLYVPIVPVQ